MIKLEQPSAKRLAHAINKYLVPAAQKIKREEVKGA